MQARRNQLEELCGGALSKALLQTDDFIGFQNAFLSMNHQNLAVEWSAFRMGTPFSVWTRPSLPHPMQRESTTPWPSNRQFGGFQKSHAHVSKQQSTWLEWTPFDQK
jgi:hypothetical protein